MEFNSKCSDCPRLVASFDNLKVTFNKYWNKPVPPFGNTNSSLVIVGLAPGLHGANATGRPFTGDHAGILLYETLYKFGFATLPKSISCDDKLRLKDTYLTNAVKCYPPQNKPLPSEIKECNKYLRNEIAKISKARVIIALGLVAHKAVITAFNLRQSQYVFKHNATHQLFDNIVLIDSYHCSRYNTQTKRLTKEMFESVFANAKKRINK
jgi:uracil-DNA glycosylase family 4